MATKGKTSYQQKLPKEIFEVLLKDKDLPTLLANGGKDLTRQQLKQVEELLAKQSKKKVQGMGESLAGTQGYNDFMSMPLISKILGNKTKTAAKTTAKKSDKISKSPKAKNPEISKVPPNTIVDLKRGDSEADILAKMLNLRKLESDQDMKMYRGYDAKKKELQDEREREFKELIDAFKPKEEKKATEVAKAGKKKFGFMKYAIIGGAGLLLSQKAFAGEVESTNRSFSESIRDVVNSIRKSLDISPSSSPNINVDLSGDEGAAKKAAEQYLGNAISTDEWDKLLRATAAEATMNPAEEAGVMATILNRARLEGGGEGSITKVLNAPRQFQAVTGTKFNPGPSEKYKKGPGEKEKSSIVSGVTQYLPNISKNQTKFTSAKPEAYGKGTNIGYYHQLKREGGVIVGGTIFGTDILGGAEPMSQNKPMIPVSNKQKTAPKKSIIIVQNNTMNSYLGDSNILISRQEETDKSAAIDQQYYRR